MKRRWWEDQPKPIGEALFSEGWRQDALAVGFLVVAIVAMLILSGCEAKVHTTSEPINNAINPTTNETVRPAPEGWGKSPDLLQAWRDIQASDTNWATASVHAFHFEGHRYLRNGDSGLIHAESCQCKQERMFH